ncbi:hypothetical protein [Propionivibrio dicarboxylicus]|uniref:Uncharacterized protein n=1 Tax=Propionivibrio dicarboxylicus TaxID=83767 RepID=A0A1G7WSK8_9RHOO|nr:hypothetical protein [Propionivibrio dicarboxylicus]SDG74888.1 hypothetical protein SAMN05660652_00620 [Propionivibrio dicarboxylicus]
MDAYIELQDASLVLVATTHTRVGYAVARLESCGDATSAFVAAMTDAYGVRLAQVVADELDLGTEEGRPLSSRTVMQALSMAETIRAALQGVSFGESLSQRPDATPSDHENPESR